MSSCSGRLLLRLAPVEQGYILSGYNPGLNAGFQTNTVISNKQRFASDYIKDRIAEGLFHYYYSIYYNYYYYLFKF